jgi:hypothetical protein
MSVRIFLLSLFAVSTFALAGCDDGGGGGGKSDAAGGAGGGGGAGGAGGEGGENTGDGGTETLVEACQPWLICCTSVASADGIPNPEDFCRAFALATPPDGLGNDGPTCEAANANDVAEGRCAAN